MGDAATEECARRVHRFYALAFYDPGGVSVGDLCGVCVVAACPGVSAAFFLRVNVLRGVLVVSVVLASLLEVVHLAGLRSVSQEGVALAKRIEALGDSAVGSQR